VFYFTIDVKIHDADYLVVSFCFCLRCLCNRRLHLHQLLQRLYEVLFIWKWKTRTTLVNKL